MQYYTLEEAARLLGVSADDVKKMAERNELRPFRDRGTMRFRGQEVEEMARRRGRGSDPELQLGEASTPRKSKLGGPPSGIGRKSKLQKPPDAPEVFDFDLPIEDDQVDLGKDLNLSSGPGSAAGRSRNKLGGPKSPLPTPGSDSDVRLVGDSNAQLDFQLASDSDVKLVDSSGPKSSSQLSGPKSASRLSKPPSTRGDSSVRMVPLDDDSGVQLGGSGRSGPLAKSPSDSDVRLDQGGPRKKPSKLGGKNSDEHLLTEEIDLDAELKKAEEASRSKMPRVKPGSTPQLPTTSPFELSEADLGLDDPSGLKDSSSDFDLTPAKQDQSPLELGSDELPAPSDSDEDEVSLGELGAGGGESGINLRDPADSGISLEQQGSEEEIEFELSLDEGVGNTPKPAPASAKNLKQEVDSDSEFELTLDDSSPSEPSSSELEPTPSNSEFELNVENSSSDGDSDSEFELTLDDSMEKSVSDSDSDSEFELSLDESGQMPALEEEAGLEIGDSEKDIFETDFEVPALEDESGSQAMALDEDSSDSGDIESSDFDLDIGEGMSEDESGSQVLALDEESEDADGAAATVARPRKGGGAAVLDEDEAEELLEEDMDFDTDADAVASAGPSRAGTAVAAPPAEWGPMPAMVMGVCVIVMFLVGLMGFELIRGMYGYRQGGPVTSIIIDPLARMFTDDLPK